MDKIYAHTYSSIVSLKSHKNQSISRKIKEKRRGKGRGGERERGRDRLLHFSSGLLRLRMCRIKCE